MDIWDVGEIVSYQDSLLRREAYTRQFHGLILVYSISRRSSFEYIEDIYRTIVKTKDPSNLPIVICATMCDLFDSREVSIEEGNQLAKKLNCSFLETSAKFNINIENLFIKIARKIRKYQIRKYEEEHPEILQTSSKKSCDVS